MFRKRDGLEELTNQRFENLHEVQQQQIQMQTLMMNQLMSQKQSVYVAQQPVEHRAPEPRRERPEPTPPNSFRAQDVPHYAPQIVTVKENIVPDDRQPDLDLDWLDQVAPLPVRPSSPILIGHQPIKVIVEGSGRYIRQ